jgi:hypothetical protein
MAGKDTRHERSPAGVPAGRAPLVSSEDAKRRRQTQPLASKYGQTK